MVADSLKNWRWKSVQCADLEYGICQKKGWCGSVVIAFIKFVGKLIGVYHICGKETIESVLELIAS